MTSEEGRKKNQLFQLFCNLCFAEWKKVKIHFIYDSIMKTAMEDF